MPSHEHHPSNVKSPATERGSHTSRDPISRIELLTNEALSQLEISLSAGKSETLRTYLNAMAKFHAYSIGNQMLIALQAPNATHVAGFHTWRKLGRFVRKGEHGIMILAPVTRVIGSALQQSLDGTLQEELIRKLVNTKSVYVFDVSQTEGEELPRLAKVNGNPTDNTMRVKSLVQSRGIELLYSPPEEMIVTGAEGVSLGGKIQIRDNLAAAEEFRVVVHELAHELLHRGERRAQTTKRTRELEAESVAFVVCTGIGLDAKESSNDYIQLYQGDRQRLLESLEHIRRVSNEILQGLSEMHPDASVRRP